ncbi:ankyrin repeat and MYND domain-containing 1-like [Pelobates cultripes]|uniref:Ankyrin repeat and MYND domain-containing 1-like n=1 Tax=Pelobates cultripes TaxID=61616 RepID=A0AAD1RAE8_PELCU|nr:ankyrin repeat and MYND domain-containing 1-like [Pelobates cultripes]
MSVNHRSASPNKSNAVGHLDEELKEPYPFYNKANRDEPSEYVGENTWDIVTKHEVLEKDSRKYAWEDLNNEKSHEEKYTVGAWSLQSTEQGQDDTSREGSLDNLYVQEVPKEMLEFQKWSDGSSYRGNISMDLKLGHGEFKWVNEESYIGEFYKDHQHGKGTYMWPDGSKFTGSFYLSRKEGYGTMRFADKRKFQGLYKSDARYGPGIETYEDNSQDVGIWLGHHIIKISAVVPGSFSISCYPKFSHMINEGTSNGEYCSPALEENEEEDPFFYRYKSLLREDSYTLPEQIYLYSTDTDHLPLPPSVRTDFDIKFCGSTENQVNQSNEYTSPSGQCSSDLKAIYLHVNKHRNSPEYLSWNLGSIMCGDRERFGTKGPRELTAERLIRKAAEGDYETVYNILRHDLAHVDVSDFNGNTALHAATVNGHNNIINLLLDNGADVSKCNDEGVTALSLCMMIFYNNKTLWPNVAERNFAPDPEGSTETRSAGSVLYKQEDSRTSPPNSTNQANQISENKDCYAKDSSDSNREATMNLLVQRGSDPSKCCIPIPALFLAIKTADFHMVKSLLQHGARTDIQLSTPYGSVTPLHIAAALPVAEGVRITEVLLHAAADPNARAGDGDYIYKQDRDEKTNPVPGFFKKDFVDSGIVLYSYFTVSSTVPEVGGRTPLHVACEREDNYKFARDVISLLLNHNANTNVLWSGHSPLSLAVASGNDLAIKELLAKGADPNMALGPPVGSVLCAAVSTTYEKQRPVPVRIGLVDKLIKSGANMLMPITIGAGKRTGLGTATDFAYYKYLQDKRIANSPYHTLSADEREIYNERRQLLDHLGKPTRDAVTLKEKEWATEGIVREPALPRHMLARRNKEWLVREESASTPRKDFFKYCCQCGRSLGVKLSACSRCYSVFTCSRLCKKRALDEFHKEECQLYTGYLSSKPSTGRTKRTGEELAVNQNYSFN